MSRIPHPQIPADSRVDQGELPWLNIPISPNVIQFKNTPVIETNSLKNPVTIKRAMIKDRHHGIFLIHQFPVKINFHASKTFMTKSYMLGEPRKTLFTYSQSDFPQPMDRPVWKHPQFGLSHRWQSSKILLMIFPDRVLGRAGAQ